MPDNFHRPTRFEAEYRASIKALLDKYFDWPNIADLGELTKMLVEFGQAKSFFDNASLKLATQMVTMVKASNATSWRQAATKSSKGRLIHSLLQKELNTPTLLKTMNGLIAQNASLITTLPDNVTYTVSNWIKQQHIAGVRHETIAKTIKAKFEDVKAYEAARLARTECSKAATAITRVRAVDMGLNWYVWATSHDARVRPGHKLLNSVLVNWDDAPAPEELARQRSEGHYHAGNIYNCRCIPVPILSLDSISWPAKIYSTGSIRRLTRSNFALISGITRRLAA
jgi:SPP1 gp7 family putative phage head morphogenesis protein